MLESCTAWLRWPDAYYTEWQQPIEHNYVDFGFRSTTAKRLMSCVYTLHAKGMAVYQSIVQLGRQHGISQ